MAPSRVRHDTTTRLVLQTTAVYERSAAECIARWERRRRAMPAFLRVWLSRLPKKARVLDLGCGTGRDAVALRRRGYRVLGFDRTTAMLAHARKRDKSLPLAQADIRHGPVRAASVDGLWAAASLMHLPKPAVRQTLVAWHQLVQPGGWLAATVTHGMRSRVVTTGWVPGRYFARWTKQELARDVERAGWQIVALEVVSNRERKGRWLNLLAKRKE